MIMSSFELQLLIFLHHFPKPKIVVFTVFITFLFILPSTRSQDEQQYIQCSQNHFSCGETIQGIGYPFWGNRRHRNCGVEEFYLTCHDDDYTTININERTFRVLHINQDDWSMRVVVDQLWDDICPQVFANITLNPPLFSYHPTYESLTLFYNCSNDIMNMTVRDTLNCPPINGVLDRRGFFSESPFPSDVTQNIEQCNSNITVPVLIQVVEEFRDNETMELRDIVNWGFDVDYRLENASSCMACEASGGLCRINSTRTTEPTCLCRNGIHHLVCRNPGTGMNLPTKLGRGLGAAVLSVVLFMCIIYWKFSTSSMYFWKRETNIDKNVEDFIRQHHSSNPKRYCYCDIKKITNSFKDVLGRGGYGSVYKGKLPDGRLVAVKILNATKGNGDEFINEVASIGRTSHVNVVTLFGFCYEGKKRALVYEYMSNGSLDKFIYNRDKHLGGEKLYEISLGIAKGLEYLHRGCNTLILHFDIKPHNILLDHDFCPKIADFGLAKMYHGKDSIVSMAGTRGTIGYIAPEVFSRSFGSVSHKSDVYSYGMMLIEMVGGKNNCDAAGDVTNSSEIYFPHWIYKRLEPNEELEVEGVMLVEKSEITRRMLIVGLWCTQTDPMRRPPMNKVIDMLVGSFEALQIPPKPFLSSTPGSSPILFSSTSGESSY